MSDRQRMTWTADKKTAAAPPATPGYDVEDQDHPAHTQGDPGPHDYENGDTSSWNEDVRPGPYTDSGAPALPGYGVEDKDHPAHAGQVGRQAGDYVKQKSAKCVRLARHMLGKNACMENLVEDQALDLMDMDDAVLDASLERMSGGFMAEDIDDEIVDDDMDVMARLAAVEARLADQNDPKGETLGTDGKGEDAEKKEEDTANKEAALAPILAMFDAYDTDGDGFISASEWGGPRSMFASIDSYNVGIIARADIFAAKKAEDDDEDEETEDTDNGDDVEGSKKSAGCEKLPEGPMRDNCEKKDDSKVTDEEKGEKTDKEAFGHMADFDEDELDMLSAMEHGSMDLDPNDLPDDVMEEVEDDGIEVMASDDYNEFFSTGTDPMGLSDRSSLTAADEAAFEDIFGRAASDDEDTDDDEKADKEAAFKPQPRKASNGPQTLGSMSRTASGPDEIKKLSTLWKADPDVSGAFG